MSQSLLTKLVCLVAAALCNLALAASLSLMATSEPTAEQVARIKGKPAVAAAVAPAPGS